MKKLFILLSALISLNSFAEGLTVVNEGQEAVCLSRIENLATKEYGGQAGTFVPSTFIVIPAEKTLTFTGHFVIDNKFGISQSGQGTCFLALNEAKEQYIYSTNIEMTNYFDIILSIILAPFIGVLVFFGLKKYDELNPKTPTKKRTKAQTTEPTKSKDS